MSLEHDGSVSHVDVYPQPFKDFISPKARKIIFWTVVGGHIAFIFLPLLLFAILALIEPKAVQVIKVSLFTDLPFDHNVQSKAPDPNNPTPSESVPPPPGELSPLPPEPAMEEPTPAVKDVPKPKEKPKEKEQPKPKETTPSPDAKKTPKDKPKEDAKPKEDSKPKKPTAEDIKKASQVVKGSTPKVQPKGKGGEFFRDLSKQLNQNNYDPNAKPGGGTNGGLGVQGNPNQDSEYYGRVGAFLKSHWQQPSRALLGNGKPTVNIRMKVDERGVIVSATIEKRSGFQVMDASVERLLAEVKTLPVPPRAMEFTISMNIEDE